jgi:predicted DNA-binding protein with PD1-like motif
MNARVASFHVARALVTTLPKGSDLLEEIERLVLENDMDFCRIEGIGSLTRATMTYYDQSTQADRQIDVDRPMMLVNAIGTALRSDAGVEVHCHLVLGDALGMASGGDLSPGCVVFSCELILQELAGPSMARALDPATGLSHLTWTQTDAE